MRILTPNGGIIWCFRVVPISWYINKNYVCLRLDREDKGGGGELVFLKKGIIIKKQDYTDFESIYFQLYVDGQLVNLISAYKSPSVKNSDFFRKTRKLYAPIRP